MSPNTLYTLALFVTFILFVLLAIAWGALMIAMYDRIMKPFTPPAPSQYDSDNTLEEIVNTPTIEHKAVNPKDAWARQETWELSRYPKNYETVKVDKISHSHIRH